MAFEKWNTSGKLTWADAEVLYAADLNGSIDETMPPIGAIIAWAKSFTGVPATLPVGWVECSGAVISDADSPLNGQTLPDINDPQSFLRGDTTSGGTGGEDTHDHTGVTSGPSATESVASGSGNSPAHANHTHTITTDGTLPVYYEIVWIMRIK